MLEKLYLDEVKKEYNSFLKRVWKGEQYLDNPDITQEEKEKLIPAFRYLLDNCSRIINTLQHEDVIMSEQEIREGFKAF